MSPKFLFRIETDPGAASDAVIASATRGGVALSFFLWSSIPDDELPISGRRASCRIAVLEYQIGGARGPEVEGVRQLRRPAAPSAEHRGDVTDPDEFPEFDDSLRDALRQETELFFESLVRDDRPVGDLLTASYTFLNQRLAEHYGIPNVFGSQFRRVTLTDQNRQGLLGQGSLLAMTSYSNRTSVVLRGKWILENILGTPPPPPPPNVPGSRIARGRRSLSAPADGQHRVNAVCASCHARMDPLGFARELPAPWRVADRRKTSIDPSGCCRIAQDRWAADLRKVLASKNDQFVMTLTEAAGYAGKTRNTTSGRAEDSARRRSGPPLVGGHHKHRQQYAVSDEEVARVMIFRNAIPQRTVPRDWARPSLPFSMPWCPRSGSVQPSRRSIRGRARPTALIIEVGASTVAELPALAVLEPLARSGQPASSAVSRT